MKPLDPALLAIASGLLALRVGSTDLVFRYLRPGMRPYLLAAGAVLVVLGGVAIVRHRRDARAHDQTHGHGHAHGDGDHEPAHAGHAHQATWLCWLLLTPVVLGAIVDPRALGASSVTPASGGRMPIAETFDLDAYLATHSSGGQVPQLTLAQYIGASRNDTYARTLSTLDVRLLGFVVSDPDHPGRRILARLQLGCCAADSVALTVEVDGDPATVGTWPAPDQWLEVTGTLDPAASDELRSGGTRVSELGMAVMRASEVRAVDPPSEPYEYP